MNLLSELNSRGLVHQVSDLELDKRLAALAGRGPVSCYVGFDPTSDSLHAGNFVSILALVRAQRAGIRPIGLVGGATGLIGDPSGKSAERQLLTKEKVAQNAAGIQRVLERFLDFHDKTAPASLVNNLDWTSELSAIDFLRDIGKHFRVGAMLGKESVKARMAASDEGMSYTEFSYQILQSYDFYRLYKSHNCVLQMGGSDQWGNITAGTDLIRKLEGEGGQAFALTTPLITTTSGAKFGKSEGNAIWLSPERTSVYDFYQFWLRTEDADAARYLRLFTFLPLPEIDAIAAEHAKAPERRIAQKKLAEEVTACVHGREAMEKARSAAEVMYGKAPDGYTAESIEQLAREVPTHEVPHARILDGWPIVDAVIECGLAKTRSDAKRLIAQGGLYLNNQPVADANLKHTQASLATASALVLRSGKKTYRIVKVV